MCFKMAEKPFLILSYIIRLFRAKILNLEVTTVMGVVKYPIF
tara:strand:+ start:1690 stop:1815 length:126 start_codon:yes stop_codon:yes gene_type:complete